jgi:hypothetical protein
MSARSMTTRALVALAGVALLGACSMSTSANQSDMRSVGSMRAAHLSSSMRFLAASEIQQSGALTAAEAIRRLRPLLLLPRRSVWEISTQYHTPLVYLDGVKAGGIEVLSTIPASRILDVRYVPESEANMLFMGAHPAGAIAVKTQYRD